MKKAIFFFLVAAVAATAFTKLPVVSYKADPAASQFGWVARKVTGQHDGHVKLSNGSLDLTDGKLTGGSFEIDMKSITNSDLQGEWSDKLVGHIKSPDFFNVEAYPTAKLVIKKAIALDSKGNYKIVGDLTIKATTKEIKFNTALTEADGTATATGRLTIDRSDFDVRYGSGSFFDGLGDKTIYDDFDINFTLVAKK